MRKKVAIGLAMILAVGTFSGCGGTDVAGAGASGGTENAGAQNSDAGTKNADPRAPK